MKNDKEIQMPEGLSPEEKQELQEAIAERKEAERLLQEAQKASKKASSELARTRREREIREAAGDRFHDTDVLIELISSKIQWDTEQQKSVIRGNSGLPRLNSNMQEMTVGDLVNELASLKPFMLKESSVSTLSRTPHQVQRSRMPERTKADFRKSNGELDYAKVSRFVDEHGELAWTNLPRK